MSCSLQRLPLPLPPCRRRRPSSAEQQGASGSLSTRHDEDATRRRATALRCLLTGADSGLGAACGAQLVALGHRVVAACLTEEGRARAAQWPGADSVVALLVDVTSDSDVAAMAVAAEAACGADTLYCVVNCASLMLPAPIEWRWTK
jgi:hypothetical protein